MGSGFEIMSDDMQVWVVCRAKLASTVARILDKYEHLYVITPGLNTHFSVTSRRVP